MEKSVSIPNVYVSNKKKYLFVPDAHWCYSRKHQLAATEVDYVKNPWHLFRINMDHNENNVKWMISIVLWKRDQVMTPNNISSI